MIARRAAATSLLCLLDHRAQAFLGPPTDLKQAQQTLKQSRVLLTSARSTLCTLYSDRDVYALDFDGVICNSQYESSRSAFRAVRELWPELVEDCHLEDGDAPTWLLEMMRELRPIVETGYENILLSRLLLEKRGKGTGSMGQEPQYRSAVDDIYANWGPDMRETLLSRYGATKEQLVQLFGATRDRWMDQDQQGWLDANLFYEGVSEAVSACSGELYVVTTKQKRFASALLKHAGLSIPEDKIFGLGSGPKPDVLSSLKEKHGESTIHFFEDRVETLEGVCQDPRLAVGVQLYLCKWGFNTPEQRSKGESNTRIELIDANRLMEILAPGGEGDSPLAAGGQKSRLDID